MAGGDHERTLAVGVRSGLGVYLGWMGVLALVHGLWPAAQAVAWVLVPVTTAGAVVGGAVLYRPAARGAWVLVGAGIGAWAAADLYIAVIGEAASTKTAPLAPQILSAVAYVVSLLGLLLLVNRRVVDDRGALVDGLTLACVLGVIGWAFLVVPYIGSSGDTWRDKSAQLIYPLVAMIRVPLLVRLLTGGGNRLPAVWLLVGATAAGFVSDVVYAGIWLSGRQVSVQFGPSIGWTVSYALWGAAALHPSMVKVGEPVSHRTAENPWPRLVVLGGACLIAPVALLIWALRHSEGELTVLGTFSSIVIVLVLGRMGLLFAQYLRAGHRERIVSAAGIAMVSAVSVDDVVDALDRAGEELLGGAGRGRLVMAWPDGQGAEVSGLVPVEELPESLAALADGQPAALLSPVGVGDSRKPGRAAVLMATGVPRDLVPLRESVETLAGQAALAIGRVELADEVRRRASEEYFRTLIQNAADGIMIVTERGWIRFASPSARRLFAPRRPTGKRLRDLVGDEAVDQVEAALAEPVPRPVHWVLRAGAVRSEVEVTVGDLRGDETVRAIVLTLRDVTEQRELQARLTQQALHDPLTGLPNRRQFQQRLDEAFSRGAGAGAEPVYLVLLDLDDFKDINDTLGHAVGDELLVAVGARLSAAVRPTDVPARVGGDEFAVLLTHVPAPAAAEALAERIVTAFSTPFVLDGELTSVGASVGLANSAQAATAEELLRNADLALYLAKSEGKSGWQGFAPELHDELIERAGVRARLDQAIADRSIETHYQPIVDLADGRVVGFEALARLPHPERGLLSPDRFIPLAERTGQIVPLGRQILEVAAADAVFWNGERLAGADRGGAEGVWVGVNVSARQLDDPGFPDSVARILKAHALPPSLLVLEITETSLLQSGEQPVADVLAALKDLGVRIALDDFGTGFSSLSYLTELPVDILKIDKSFVVGSTASRERAALVEGIIHIAAALDIAVIAEGIETEAQRRLLKAARCGFGQGYLFSRPVAAAGVRKLMEGQGAP